MGGNFHKDAIGRFWCLMGVIVWLRKNFYQIFLHFVIDMLRDQVVSEAFIPFEDENWFLACQHKRIQW